MSRRALPSRWGGPLLAVLALGLMALLQHWLVDRRPLAGEAAAGEAIEVTSGADSGPGSLREAIFAANRSPQRARIVMLAPVIALRRALPPLANPRGIDLESGPLGSRIDAGEAGPASVLDIDAPGSSVRGVEIERAPGIAILVRAPEVRLTEVSVSGATTGIAAVDGAEGLMIERCHLDANGIGLHLDPASLPATLSDSKFSRHREAGLWAVGPAAGAAAVATFRIRGNHFSADRIGTVLGNVRAKVTDNTFEQPAEAALYLLGGGIVARSNRIDDALRFGIVVEGSNSTTLVEGNEIRASAAIGILVRAGLGPTLRNNRLDVGAYGIADVLSEPAQPTIIEDNLLSSHRLDAVVVVGSSPLLRRNRMIRNRGAAIRSLDFIDLDGSQVLARPLLEANELEGNGTDGVVTGVYRASAENERKEEAQEEEAQEKATQQDENEPPDRSTQQSEPTEGHA